MFSSKSFSDFLPPSIYESIILSQVKSTDPKSIPIKILKLLQVQISKHLTNIFNLSLNTGIFPHSLKSSKVIPIHKKSS